MKLDDLSPNNKKSVIIQRFLELMPFITHYYININLTIKLNSTCNYLNVRYLLITIMNFIELIF